MTRRHGRRAVHAATDVGTPAGAAPPASRDRARRPVLAGLVAVVTFLVYAGAGRLGFIDGYDDALYVTANEVVQKGLTAPGVAWAFGTFHAANWHPLTWLSHMLDVSLFGLSPAGHHAMSVALHVVVTVLLFLVLERASGEGPRSAFVAAMFGVHPAHVESVAWVAGRKDVLSALCFVLALAAWTAYARRAGAAPPERSGSGPFYGLALAAFAGGLMSKPMLVTVPLVLLLFDLWPLRRFETTPWRRLCAEKLPFAALALASAAVTMLAQARGGTLADAADLPFDTRAGNALVSYAAYAGSLLWPRGLAAYYPYVADRPPLQLAGALLLFCTLTILALRARRRAPYVTSGWLWFVVMLVPVIGIVQVGGQARADRYTYLPSIGCFALVAWGVPALCARFAVPARAAAVAGVAAILACATMASVQVGTWTDALTLWGRAVEVTENNAFAHVNYAVALDRAGRAEDAEKQYAAAVAADPGDLDARRDHALLLGRLGRMDDAAKELEDVIRRDPSRRGVRFDLGYVLLEAGRLDDAIRAFEVALAADPGDDRAKKNLVVARVRRGVELGSAGKYDDSLRHLQAAVALDPRAVDAQINLGLTLVRLQRYDEALRAYTSALESDPRAPKAHANLAALFVRMRRFDDAWRHVDLCRQAGGEPPQALLDALGRLAPRGR